MVEFENAPISRITTEEKKFEYHWTRFNFLNQIGGLPVGCMIGILGVPGGGKSTLARTIAIDIALSKKVLIWSSEETKENYSNGLVGVNSENVKILAEHSIKKEITDKMHDVDYCMEYVQHVIIKSRADVLIFDNITTSILYDDKHVSQQSKIARGLNRLASKMNKSIIILIHTKKGAGRNFITYEDVRGSNQTAMLCPLFFTMHSFGIENRMFNFISVDKCRYWEMKNKIYELEYNNKLYISDRECQNSRLRSIFKLRNKT